MKICFLGAGNWGFVLSALLASKGHEVKVWSRRKELVELLNRTGVHPSLANLPLRDRIFFTTDLAEALHGAELIAEAVTSNGIPPVLRQIQSLNIQPCPFVLTSKGIHEEGGRLLPETLMQILGEEWKKHVGCLSGPSMADEVLRGLPTSVVAAAYDFDTVNTICEAFQTPYFRVYPNMDMNGVCFGGAMKNIIAIACGISDGLGLGDNTKATLMTRGLHEMRKLAVVKECKPETLNGLAGLGDLCVTCLHSSGRNYSFGRRIAKGESVEGAKKSIGMVVEGIYACAAVVKLAREHHIPIPIIEGVYQILYKGMTPHDAVKQLMARTIKEEHL